MFWRGVLALIMGLGIGALIGAVGGWYFPINEVSVGIDRLSPAYQAEYTVMVGAAFGADHDWDRAQERLGRLALPDPAGYLVIQSERYIAEGRNPDNIRSLVRLAAQMGYTTPPMQPYLPELPGS